MLFAVLFLVVALYKEFFRPAVSFFIVIVFLNITGILSPEEVMHGFGNEQLAVIMLLLIISDIVRKSSVVDAFFFKMVGSAAAKKPFLRRMMIVVALFSSFFNNTPLVAMMMPHVAKWSRKNQVPVSQLMIPLSYAAILGGCITLVGTSTNLIVNGMAIDAGLESLHILDFTPVGLPMLLIGLVYLLIVGAKWLPSVDGAITDFMEHSRDYLLEVEVKADSQLIGKSVEKGGLRNLQGLFLVEILRNKELITPISPQEKIEKEDVLIFSGNTKAIEELVNPAWGLTLPRSCEQHVKNKQVVSEVVVSHNSYLIGKRLKDSDFRGKYDSAIIAVHRNGEKLSGKIGHIELRAGDVLLVFGGKDFQKRTKGNQAFYSISEVHEPEDVNVRKVGVLLVVVLLAIVLSAFHLFSLFTGLLLALMIAVFMKIVPIHEIRKGLDFNLLFLLAAGLALGKAMINSGAAQFVAEGLLQSNELLNPFGLILGIFLLTNLMSSYMTNKAAIAIIFPISLTLAQSLQLPLAPFILVVCFGAAANFITPIGYQTNLMVYGPGGYTFRDFFKIGLPLTLIYALVCTTILCLTYNLF
jgi:di/tricarboxylate transporter